LNPAGALRKNDGEGLVDGALSKAARGDEARKAEDMIGMAVCDREDRR
jgi:hypothetical protein